MFISKSVVNGKAYYKLDTPSAPFVSVLCLYIPNIKEQLEKNGLVYKGYNDDGKLFLDGKPLSELDLPEEEITPLQVEKIMQIEQQAMSEKTFNTICGLSDEPIFNKQEDTVEQSKPKTEVKSSGDSVLKQPTEYQINTREELVAYIRQIRKLYSNYDDDKLELPRLNEITNPDALFTIEEVIDSMSEMELDETSINPSELLQAYHSLRTYNFVNFSKFQGMSETDFLKKFYEFGVDGIKNKCTNIEVQENCTAVYGIHNAISSSPIDSIGSKIEYKVIERGQKGSGDCIVNEEDYNNAFANQNTNKALVQHNVKYNGKYPAVVLTYITNYGESKAIISRYGIMFSILNKCRLFFDSISVNTGLQIRAKINTALDKVKMEKYLKAALVLYKEIYKNVKQAPCNDIYDTMRYFGLTEYEKFQFTCLLLKDNPDAIDEIVSEYYSEDMRPKQVNLVEIAGWVNGLPDWAYNYLGIEHNIEALRAFIESGKVPDTPVEFETFIEARVYLAIIDEEFNLGAESISPLSEVQYITERVEGITEYFESNNCATLDGIEVNIGSIESSYNCFIENYYTILNEYALADKFVFARAVVREPVMLGDAREQNDIGIAADYIPMGETSEALASLRRSANTIIPSVFLRISSSFKVSISNDSKLSPKQRAFISRWSNVYAYEYVKTLYYLSLGNDKIQPDEKRLNIQEQGDKVLITINLGMIQPVIDNVIITTEIRMSDHNLIVNHIKNYKNHDVKDSSGLKLQRSYISIYDFMRIEFAMSNKTQIKVSLFPCNCYFDYTKVYNRDEYSPIMSMPAKSLLQNLKFAAGSSACFYDNDSSITQYLAGNSNIVLGDKAFSQQMYDDIYDVLDGNLNVKGIKNITLPIKILQQVYINDCKQSKTYKNHARTLFDTRYPDDVLEVLRYTPVNQESIVSNGKSKEEMMAMSEQVFEVPRVKDLINNMDWYRDISAIVNYKAIDNIEEFYNFYINSKSIKLNNGNYFVGETRVKEDSPELLALAYKVNEHIYLVRCSGSLLQISIGG